MTTASIGKGVSVAGRARIALVSRRGNASLGSIAARSGHEVVECHEWADLGALINDHVIDLILVEEELLADRPAGLSIPAMVLSDRQIAAEGCVGSIAADQLAAVAEPMFALIAALGHSMAQCRDLGRIVNGIRSGATMIGNTPVMRRLQSSLSRAADADATVLIEGPAGAGKSLAARMIHCKSRRGSKPIDVVEAASIDGDALSAALVRNTDSTLVIENVENLPSAAQAVLVRHLKERTTSRGQNAPRIVTTTASHLPEMVARGAFREDLYYRLHAMPIVVPALRERIEDIAMIADSVLAASAQPTGRTPVGFTPAARALLDSMPWPGNVAQLEAVVSRAQAMAGGAAIDRDHVINLGNHNHVASGAPSAAAVSAKAEVEIGEESIRPFEEEEQELLSRALRATKGNVRRAAQLLGIGRATLYRKIQQYRLRMQ